MAQPQIHPEPYEPERPARRGYRWLVAVAIIAVFAGAGIVTWSLVNEGTKPTPKPSASIPSTADWVRYTSPYGYTLRHPSGWTVSRFEGHDELYPPGVPSLARGGDTFALDVTTPSLTSGPECVLAPNALTIGGAGVAGCETVSAAGEHGAWYEVPVAGTTYIAHLIGSTQTLWDANIVTGRTVLQSMAPVAAPSVTRGSIAAEVRRDGLSTGLIGFLEARTAGEGTDYWLSDNAAQLYVARPNGLTLYGWSSYRVTVRRDVDANSSEFDVRLTAANGAIETETIGVGPGSNVAGVVRPAIIRFAVRTR